MSKRLKFESDVDRMEFKRPEDAEDFFGNSDETKEFLDAVSKKFEERLAGRCIIFENEISKFFSECLGVEHGHCSTIRGIIKETRDE